MNELIAELKKQIQKDNDGNIYYCISLIETRIKELEGALGESNVLLKRVYSGDTNKVFGRLLDAIDINTALLRKEE